jgi:hypothetical protein
MSTSVPNKASEQTTTVEEPKPLAVVPFLHTTLLWPEGVEGECPHCDKKFETGQRIAVLDARYYQKNVSEGNLDEETVYGHALCIQEAARGGRGWIPLTTLA